MSSGSGSHGRPIDRADLEEVLDDPAVVEALEEDFEIDTNHDHDLPYLAGYSENGKTRYVDRHLGGDRQRRQAARVVEVLAALVEDHREKSETCEREKAL